MSTDPSMQSDAQRALDCLLQQGALNPPRLPALGEFLQHQALPEALQQDAQQQANNWQQLCQRRRALQQQRQRQAGLWLSAAMLLLTLGVVWRVAPERAEVIPQTAQTMPARATSEEGLEQVSESLAVLRGLSQQLEQEWQAQQQRPRTLSGAQLAYQQQLSRLIASVDAQLGQPQQAQERERRLWQQRVVLMNELVANETQLSAWSQTVAL